MKRVALLMLSGLFLAACNSIDTVTWGPNLYHWGDAKSVGKPMSASATPATVTPTWQEEVTAEAEEEFTDMAMEVDDFSQSAQGTGTQGGVESGTLGGTESETFAQGQGDSTQTVETAEATDTESVETEMTEDTVTDAQGKDDGGGFDGK